MGPIKAIKTALFKKYFTFSGRASLSEFWWYAIFAALVVWQFNCFSQNFKSSLPVPYVVGGEPIDWRRQDLHGVDFVIIFVELLIYIPLLSVTIRRLHDRNMSAWWALLFCGAYLDFKRQFLIHLFPVLYNAIYLDTILFLVGVFGSLILLQVLAKRGTVGLNRFGQDPIPSKLYIDTFS